MPFAANLVRFGSNLASNLEVPAGPLEAHHLTLGSCLALGAKMAIFELNMAPRPPPRGPQEAIFAGFGAD